VASSDPPNDSTIDRAIARPHSQAILLGRKEMLKDPLTHLLREPSAEVADRRANHAIDCRIRRKHHTAEMSGRVLHGIKSVQTPD